MAWFHEPMLNALPIVGLILGIVCLVAGVLALAFVWRVTRGNTTRAGTHIRAGLFAAGLVTAIATSLIKYYPDPNTMIYGFPFLSFVFQKRGAQWLDFVGPLTPIALAANALVGFLFPFVVAGAYLWRGGRRAT